MQKEEEKEGIAKMRQVKRSLKESLIYIKDNRTTESCGLIHQ